MKHNLSPIQHNLALVVGLEDRKIAAMRELADQFETLAQLETTYMTVAQVFKETAGKLEAINETSKKSMEQFGMYREVAEFLAKHTLEPTWKEKK